MNGYPLIETVLVAFLVGGSLFYVARHALAGIRAASRAKAAGCGGCSGCGGCPPR